jgi:hypothetical protein
MESPFSDARKGPAGTWWAVLGPGDEWLTPGESWKKSGWKEIECGDSSWGIKILWEPRKK